MSSKGDLVLLQARLGRSRVGLEVRFSRRLDVSSEEGKLTRVPFGSGSKSLGTWSSLRADIWSPCIVNKLERSRERLSASHQVSRREEGVLTHERARALRHSGVRSSPPPSSNRSPLLPPLPLLAMPPRDRDRLVNLPVSPRASNLLQSSTEHAAAPTGPGSPCLLIVPQLTPLLSAWLWTSSFSLWR